jgi:hypothetical protein
MLSGVAPPKHSIFNNCTIGSVRSPGTLLRRFSDFERALRDRGGERSETERIGKKYQWIALDELLARLSDNVHPIAPYRNSADQSFFRDCDPSILATSEQDTPWWQPREIVMGAASAEAAHAWVSTDEDAEIASDLFVVENTDDRQWLRLYGSIKQSDAESPRHRESWSRVTTVLVRKADRDNVLAALKGKHISDPSGHLPPTFTDAGYLGEFPWRDTWPEVEQDRSGLCGGLPVAWPVIGYHWESHLDLSLGGALFHLPCRWLYQALGLSSRPGTPGIFVDADGETVFIGHAKGAIIDSRRFLAFLDRSEWDCLWLIGGEKKWWPDGMGRGTRERWVCRYHSGIFWWDKGWQSRTWSDFQSRGG